MYKTVVVSLIADRAGRSRIRYGADLAFRLKGELVMLAPVLPEECRGSMNEDASPGLVRMLGDFPGLKARIETGSGEYLRDCLDAVDGCLGVVSQNDGHLFGRVPRIYAADESRFCRSGAVRIVMPIGGRKAAPNLVATVGVLARQLGCPVDVYHTTWPDPGRPTEDEPILHMLPEARENAERVITELGPASARLAVEMAPAVTVGIHQYTLKTGGCLIVMTPGEGVIRGSYVEELIERSSVPVLFVPREEKS